MLTPDGGISPALLGMLSVSAGLTVANIYYNQPLLPMIARDLGVSEFRANLLTMITQAGYAAGLLFIVPMGDLFPRRRVLTADFALLILALAALAAAPGYGVAAAASFVIGVCSVVPQIFVPIAAQFSSPDVKNRNVGMVISGLLTGILASRVVSGMVGEWFGWRTMFAAGAVTMLLCGAVLLRMLPGMKPTFSGGYGALMRSLVSLLAAMPLLRLYALRAAAAFGSCLALWACLAFRLGGSPFFAGSDVAGLLGLCGVAGAMAASFVGRWVTRFGVRRFNLTGCALMLAAWLLMGWGPAGYAAIIAGILLLDIGMQCIQLSNQTAALALRPEASSRVNTLFMTTYFLGGTLGTLSAGAAWNLWGWSGVAAAGMLLAGASLVMTLISEE